MQDIR